MKYKNIDEIRTDFGIAVSDIPEIKKELKQILKEIHPDKNGEKFKSKLDEVNYHKVLSALEFLEQEFALVPTVEFTALTALLKDSLSPVKEQKQFEILDKKIEALVKSYRDSSYVPKISSAAIAVIITFLWLFPATIKDHPVLSQLISPDSLFFTIFWIYSLVVTGAYWLLAKRRENRIEEATKKLSLELIQNRLFEMFIDNIKSNKGPEYKSFSKDELITFIKGLDFFDLGPGRHTGITSPFEILLFMRRIDRNISLDMAQTLADIIIERAKKKNIISLKSDNNLSDTYVYK